MVKMKATEVGNYLLTGELVFDTVTSCLHKSLTIFDSLPKVCFDLAGISRADSAGLALIIEWLREAKKRRVELTLVNVPEQLKTLARVSGVEEILPF